MSLQRIHQRGFTLIELMVALTVAMVLSLALFGLLAVSEGRRRDTTGINDADQAGQLALYWLDQWGRNAGSGFLAKADPAYGCTLHARSVSGQTLPLTEALPAPFASVSPSGGFALAPALIVPGGTTPGVSGKSSDVLVLMGGASGAGGAPIVMTAAPAAAALTVNNSLGLNGGELLLLTDPSLGAAGNCLITQVASAFTGGTSTSVTLGGDFYGDSIGGFGLADLTVDAVALPLGHPATNAPQFLVVGVGDHDTLYTDDLLQTQGQSSALQPRVQGVFEMHALYGVDTDGDGVMDGWASPSTGSYAPANLLAGSSSANTLLRRIKAIRVGLILRVPLYEKQALGTTSLTLFPDLASAGLSVTRNLSSDEQHYRYRTVEATLVLRNNVMVE